MGVNLWKMKIIVLEYENGDRIVRFDLPQTGHIGHSLQETSASTSK